ncbi:hypothetical protein [Methylobacterium sp. A54F]
MRNPLRRTPRPEGPKPTLRERAAALKETAARVMRRRTADRSEAGSTKAPEVDPIFAAIGAHRAAWWNFGTAVDFADRSWVLQQGGDASDVAMAAARAAWASADRAEKQAWNALFSTQATTIPGLLALARYAQRQAKDSCQNDGSISVDQCFAAIAEALAAIAARPAAAGGMDAPTLPRPPAQPNKPTPPARAAADQLDLSGCGLSELCRLFEAFRRLRDAVTDSQSAPAFRQPSKSIVGTINCTRGYSILGDEYQRLGFITDRLVAEIALRTPAGRWEHDDALAARLTHELDCECRIVDAALWAEVKQAWGL